MGLLSGSGKPHPYLEQLLIIPYHDEAGGLNALRFRRLSDDDTYEGAKYLSLRHGINHPSTLYLGRRGVYPFGLTCPTNPFMSSRGSLMS